jgi:twinfilin
LEEKAVFHRAHKRDCGSSLPAHWGIGHWHIAMARANLAVDRSVTDHFLAAQETRNVRLILIKIVEESIIFQSALDKVGSVQEDFDSLLSSHFVANEACFGLFNLCDDENTAQSWAMVVWIPEECRVRDKMLYSSSREDLKKSLGLGYFRNDYATNAYEDLTWNQYQASINKDFNPDVLTENERLVLEEKAMTITESNRTKATALGIIPFALSPEVQEKMLEFKENGVNWLEMNVVSEVVQLLHARNVEASGSYAQYMNDEVAR